MGHVLFFKYILITYQPSMRCVRRSIRLRFSYSPSEEVAGALGKTPILFLNDPAHEISKEFIWLVTPSLFLTFFLFCSLMAQVYLLFLYLRFQFFLFFSSSFLLGFKIIIKISTSCDKKGASFSNLEPFKLEGLTNVYVLFEKKKKKNFPPSYFYFPLS